MDHMTALETIDLPRMNIQGDEDFLKGLAMVAALDKLIQARPARDN